MLVPKTKPPKIQAEQPADRDQESADESFELTKEEVLESFERGFRQMLDGETRPALDFLDAVDNE